MCVFTTDRDHHDDDNEQDIPPTFLASSSVTLGAKVVRQVPGDKAKGPLAIVREVLSSTPSQPRFLV